MLVIGNPRPLASGLRVLDVCFHISRHRVRFENGYQSEGLARILEFIMQHQNSFVLPMDHGRQGLLQIPTPTEEESTAAAAALNEAFERLDVARVEPALA